MTADALDAIEFRPADLGEILELREDELIRGTGREREFPGDRDPTTRHFGAFRQGTCVGCLSAMLSEWEGAPAWQVRGMAVAADWRGRGVGARLLARAEALLVEERAGPGGTRVRLLWCNARRPAVGFYEKQGWRVVSGPFEIPSVGPHVRMVKGIGEAEV
ncbi:MAG: Acetyltransferase (GNAT) family protein [candidate division BRC1 bacterium ADurb.BinA292]|nr:MAG: Acetyltransferase (GNAT) family protein [candidate division BRC1 bacterium ADurb.BinA292]